MDYFRAAFDGFAPQSDIDAALKLSLDAIFVADRIDDLGAILSPDSGVGGIEGEPGWILERRLGDGSEGYEGWPPAAKFRSFVEPESYSLRHPEFFCDAMTFHAYAGAILKVFVERHPGERERVLPLMAILEKP